jgi:hypothetical protein
VSWQGGLGKERDGQAHPGSIKLFLGVVKFIIGWRIKECKKYEREREREREKRKRTVRVRNTGEEERREGGRECR